MKNNSYDYMSMTLNLSAVVTVALTRRTIESYTLLTIINYSYSHISKNLYNCNFIHIHVHMIQQYTDLKHKTKYLVCTWKESEL